ncbi:MAG: large conductance mechanosensitive channel protein MscL [Celeribacter sp.]|jgi:large conductance mechanosensitive channel
MFDEFRKFIARGNVMDMAVGIIIGAAFTSIVQSMVNDLINPVIGVITGGIDFSDKFVVLSGDGPFASLIEAREAGAAVFAYGAFLSSVINFLIIAFVVFLLVRYVNRLRRMTETPAAEAPKVDPGPSEKDLLAEIRDELRQQRA